MNTNLKSLLEAASQTIPSCTVADAQPLLGSHDVIFVDVRDQQEVLTDGKLPGSVNISRGMLEFAIDPQSPYYQPLFWSDKRLIFYCKSGGRSALAAQRAKEMGVQNILNMTGGLLEWKKAEAPIQYA
ncbi:MAG: rhodanese-like domain-containing protein [Saprospiraceae bacterium]